VSRGLALRGAILTSEERLVDAAAAFAGARACVDSPSARWSIWEAELWLARGEVERALAATRDNLEACRKRGWAGHVAHCHVVLGRGALSRGALPEAEDELDSALDWCVRSREVELTLEARLLELGIARAGGDEARAAEARGHVLDAAVAGAFGLIGAQLQR
jgi:hypothetical protein